MKIYAPVKDANGVYASVRFVNGVGETDNPHLIEWFRSHGYKVPIEEDAPTDEGVVDESEFVEINKIVDDEPELMGYNDKKTDEPDFESMTPLELREWAKEHGLGLTIKNIRNREKLLEIVRGVNA